MATFTTKLQDRAFGESDRIISTWDGLTWGTTLDKERQAIRDRFRAQQGTAADLKRWDELDKLLREQDDKKDANTQKQPTIHRYERDNPYSCVDHYRSFFQIK